MILVIEYLKYINANNPVPDIEKPLRSKDMRDLTTAWYAEYINKSDEIV